MAPGFWWGNVTNKNGFSQTAANNKNPQMHECIPKTQSFISHRRACRGLPMTTIIATNSVVGVNTATHAITGKGGSSIRRQLPSTAQRVVSINLVLAGVVAIRKVPSHGPNLSGEVLWQVEPVAYV
jgi:hypothetical protein